MSVSPSSNSGRILKHAIGLVFSAKTLGNLACVLVRTTHKSNRARGEHAGQYLPFHTNAAVARISVERSCFSVFLAHSLSRTILFIAHGSFLKYDSGLPQRFPGPRLARAVVIELLLCPRSLRHLGWESPNPSLTSLMSYSNATTDYSSIRSRFLRNAIGGRKMRHEQFRCSSKR